MEFLNHHPLIVLHLPYNLTFFTYHIAFNLTPLIIHQMKIFSWVQNKLTGKKPNPSFNHDAKQPSKEEFNDWHHGLLTIGTFGNKVKQEAVDHDQKANPLASTQDHHVNYLHGLTPDEVGKLQKELNLIFQEHHGGTGPTSAGLEGTDDVPLDRFLDDEERVCGGNSDDSDSINKKDDHCSNKTSLVQSRGKDIYLDNSKAAIGKKSLSFLLKKMFVCRGGFSPAPISLRDPTMESRMEKMLKALLHKKIYPQNYGTKLSTKKSLERNPHMAKTGNGDEKNDKADDGSKWVKTDSEYIVLEI